MLAGSADRRRARVESETFLEFLCFAAAEGRCRRLHEPGDRASDYRVRRARDLSCRADVQTLPSLVYLALLRNLSARDEQLHHYA